MFLGLIGDPNAGEWDIQMKPPARFGVVNNKGMSIPYMKQGIQGFYNSPGTFHQDDNGKHVSFKEFDILINPKYWQDLSVDSDTPELVAHEARHRGMDIIFTNPWTLSKIPQQLQDYRGEQSWPMKHNAKEYWDSWEHYCMWSLERRGRSNYGPGYIFRSKEEMLKFRAWYYQLEAIAKQYVATIKVPPGGYEALRKEVDRQTPGDVKINILPGPDGIPIIKGIIDKVGDAVSQGANHVVTSLKQGANIVADKVKQGVDKVKSALDIGTTPAKPSSSKKADEASWYGSLLARIKKNAGLGSKTHVIKAGDTLRKIAQTNNISVDKLIKANPQIKNPDAIYAGDELIIP
jgi:LysM repeat protein